MGQIALIWLAQLLAGNMHRELEGFWSALYASSRGRVITHEPSGWGYRALPGLRVNVGAPQNQWVIGFEKLE